MPLFIEVCGTGFESSRGHEKVNKKLKTSKLKNIACFCFLNCEIFFCGLSKRSFVERRSQFCRGQEKIVQLEKTPSLLERFSFLNYFQGSALGKSGGNTIELTNSI